MNTLLRTYRFHGKLAATLAAAALVSGCFDSPSDNDISSSTTETDTSSSTSSDSSSSSSSTGDTGGTDTSGAGGTDTGGTGGTDSTGDASGTTTGDSSGTTTGETPTAISDFSGVTSVTSIARTSAVVNWTAHASAVKYQITLTLGATTAITDITDPTASSTTLTGLSKNSDYTVAVHAFNAADLEDTNTATSSFATLGDFGGIASLTVSAGTTVATLAWSAHDEATSYEIFDVSSGSAVSVDTVSGGTQNSYSYTIPVERQNDCSTLTMRVRANFSGGDADTNEVDLSTFTSGPAGVEHDGWGEISATGPIIDPDGTTSTAASVKFAWSDMSSSLTSGSISGWHIYRSTSPGISSFTTPYATITSASTRTYTDSSVSEGTTYYYQVRPYMNESAQLGCQIPVSQTNHPRELKLPVPPRNMVLVHRWMANKVICSELQQTSTPTLYPLDNYSCSFNSLGAAPPAGYGITTTSGRYDFGYNLAVDKWELGCNYSHGGNSCNNGTAGCLYDNDSYTGSGASVGEVIYTRHNGTCQVKYTSSGADNYALTATVDEAFNSQSTDADVLAVRANLFSNSRHLPPITNVDQNSATAACGTFSTPAGYSENKKRLLMRREQVVAAAWDLSSLTQSQVATKEAGSTDFTTTTACNTNRGSATQGITEGTVSQWASGSVNADSLPYIASPSARVVRTGSNATASCISKFGIQDHVGNVEEWLSDQFAGKDLSDGSCTTSKWYGQTSTVDANNTYFSDYSLSETSTGTSNGRGPAWTQTASGVVQTFSYAKIKNSDVNANMAAGSTTHTTMGWNPALGTLQLYPSESAMASAGVLEILGNPGTQVTGNGGVPTEIVGSTFFNDDKIYAAGSSGTAACGASHATARGLVAGGKANLTGASTPIAAQDVGRWYFNLANPVTTKGQAIGARCAVRID